MPWASAGSLSPGPARRAGRPGSAAGGEPAPSSQAVEKLLLLLCNWHYVRFLCALGIEADREQKPV